MSARFRLTPANPLEQDIQSQIIAYLRIEQSRGRIAWFERGKGKVTLSGALAGGPFFALEFKQHDEKPACQSPRPKGRSLSRKI